MPKQPKHQKTVISIVVNGEPISVTLYPPSKRRKSWYAYWAGLTFARSTGQRHLKEAIVAAENMVHNGGSRSQLADTVLSDAEFDEIQRRHYGKKKDAEAQKRAAKSFVSCMEAITAFREITGLKPIAIATAADCERFQHEALKKPKNWRSKYPKSKEDTGQLSPNTVIKWSGALQAAFERANRNAGRKCVRGVVPEEKLLTENPWRMFTWIEGREAEIRQFDSADLISFLKYLEQHWTGLTVATLVAKVCLWSWGRKSEVVGLEWENLRSVGDEFHFAIVGKWGVDKWFRVPQSLYHDLLAIKTSSPHVFAAYNEQLRRFYEAGSRPWLAEKVSEDFNPINLGDWFYERVRDWSKSRPEGTACIHIFRKTTLQYARSGEDVNRQVAADARLGEGVMMTNYVRETDEEMRQKSNRTFHRIVASLPPEVAARYGHEQPKPRSLQEQVAAAVEAENWDLANKLTAELAKRNRQAG
jgi:hypothetical protein